MRLGTATLLLSLFAASVALTGCSSSSSSGTSGGNGTIVVPLAGIWSGSWSRETTITDLINDTEDATTHLYPEDGVAQLQITSASGSSQTISGDLLMSGFSCFDTGRVSGTWSGSNIGMTAVSASTQVSTSGISTTVTQVSGGTGYTSVPTVTFSSPDVSTGTTATGTAVIGKTGGVVSIAVGKAGTGYSDKSTVEITAPDLADGVQAKATVSVADDDTIAGFVVTEAGSGYTKAPGVTVIDPDSTPGKGAVATATLTDTAALGLVSQVIVDNVGSGYEMAPTVSISGGGGSGASFTAALASTVTIEGTGVRLALSGHQTAGGQIRLAYSVASGTSCEAKRGSILLTKSS